MGIISSDYFIINDNYSGLLREAEYNVKNYPYPAEFNYYVIVDLIGLRIGKLVRKIPEQQ